MIKLNFGSKNRKMVKPKFFVAKNGKMVKTKFSLVKMGNFGTKNRKMVKPKYFVITIETFEFLLFLGEVTILYFSVQYTKYTAWLLKKYLVGQFDVFQFRI